MNVLSLFDGMSCGRLALERAGLPVDKYYASEIDKYAIAISKKNFPDVIHVGDVKGVRYTGKNRIDLLIGGSPCQGFSFCGDQLAFDDPRSALFFEYVRLLNEIREHNPDLKFLLENVPMKKEFEAVITRMLGVRPITINSALVSGQKRRRLYWTNIKGILPPKDKGILLRDILERPGYPVTYEAGIVRDHSEKSTAIDSNYWRGLDNKGQRTVVIPADAYLSPQEIQSAVLRYKSRKFKTGNRRGNMVFPDRTDRKSKCIVAQMYKTNRTTVHVDDGQGIRKLTPIECERLQTVPDGYTEGVSDTQRYTMLGNGWTVDVIAHIFRSLK